MDVDDLRESLETILDLAALLTSGEQLSEDDLASIDAVIKETREKLTVKEVPREQRFPRDHWVFAVERKQFIQFSVEAADEGKAFAKAAEHLHDNIEALRFTWDRRDPLALSPLTCVRAPENT